MYYIQYYNQRLYMGNMIHQAESLSGKNLVLKVPEKPDMLKKNGRCSQACMLFRYLWRGCKPLEERGVCQILWNQGNLQRGRRREIEETITAYRKILYRFLPVLQP